MTTPFIVMCAPNGARKRKVDHPALPIGPDDLASCAESVSKAGASIIHIHVRDDEGEHSLDAGRYREATAAIRDRVADGIIIQVTTEACGRYQPNEQMAMVRALEPEAVSLAIRELNPDQDENAARFYAWLTEAEIFVQHILYSPDDIERFETLRRKGVILDERPFVLFVLGRYSSDNLGDVTELPSYIAAASDETEWAVCSFGNTEHLAADAASISGGHVRVGFENNLLMPDGSLAKDNAALVSVAASFAGDRPVANANDVREMFGLKG